MERLPFELKYNIIEYLDLTSIISISNCLRGRLYRLYFITFLANIIGLENTQYDVDFCSKNVKKLEIIEWMIEAIDTNYRRSQAYIWKYSYWNPIRSDNYKKAMFIKDYDSIFNITGDYTLTQAKQFLIYLKYSFKKTPTKQAYLSRSSRNFRMERLIRKNRLSNALLDF